MFQNFASELAAQNDLFLAGLALAVLIFGFLLAQILLPRFAKPIHKVGISVWLSGLYLVGTIGYIVVQGANSAFQEMGTEADPVRLGAIYLGAYVLTLILGFGFGLSARGRSISICGKGGFAFLALIPGLNAAFFAWKPNPLFLEDNPPKWYKTMLGVGAAFVLSGAATLMLDPSVLDLDDYGDYAEYDAAEAEYEAQLIAQQINDTSLGDALWRFASDMSGGYYLDEDLYLLDVDGTGTNLQFLYEVETGPEGSTEEFEIELVSVSCLDPVLRVFLEANAQVQHVFLLPDGSNVVDVTVELENCAILGADSVQELAAVNG